ncbi:Hypothetical predicted protein, partial [Mytilus galloprovincialis]
VNTNGDLTFISALSRYTPESFPFQRNASVIATYWADVDTRTVGDVWYRETRNPTLLGRASSDIRTSFPQQPKFNASWIFITTWDDVTFFGADEVGQTKRCSFQCILATDGRYSFVVFNYNLTQWTTGTASGGYSSDGVGGTPAQLLTFLEKDNKKHAVTRMYDLNDYVFQSDNFTEINEIEDNQETEMQYASNGHDRVSEQPASDVPV